VSGRNWFGLMAAVASVAASMSLTGCGGSYNSVVKGMVMLDGKALTRGTVAYHAANGPAAYARINNDGSYMVKTGRETGLPSGEYEVTVVANEPPAQLNGPNGGPPAPGKPITPPWYRSKQTSGLKYNITPGKNEINLDLTSTPPPGYKTAKQK
jgi:hypothetical protein